MAIFVTAAWLEGHIDSPAVLLLDPRRPMRYLQGHLKHAVNLPLYKAFDAEGRLLPDSDLIRWLGSTGLAAQTTPVLYDGFDGQSGAMLAWLLEYFGRTDVHVLEVFFERWVAEGHEIFYKPVTRMAIEFVPRVHPSLRATLDEIHTDPGCKLIDFRSRDEFIGTVDRDGRPGHIPGAVNIVWRDLIGPRQEVLAPRERIDQLVAAAGIRPDDRVVAYCRSGLRAAVGYLALRQAGYDVRLYDRSYAEWARTGLPVEV